MKGFVGMKPGDLDPVNNDYLPDEEELIMKDSLAYYSGSLAKFYQRPDIERESGKQITPDDSLMIREMNLIFLKNKTKIKIVVAPLYNQFKLNNGDLAILQDIFGKENVYNFSGINEITANKYNYKKDVSHFSNRTGIMILKLMYE